MYALILGDLHLGGGLSLGKTGVGSIINSRINDQINLLDWVLDKSVNLDVTDIILTGDVFEDPKPLPNLITFFLSWLKKCQNYSINVHIIVGNHDVLRSGNNYISPLDIITECDLENVFVYSTIDTIIINKSAFTLVPFRDRKSFYASSNIDGLNFLKESFTYELSSIPITYHKVMVGHLALEGSIPVANEIDDIANELLCPLTMFEGYEYVWMGHIHKQQVLSNSPYIAHTGSMDISNFGESDHKKQIVIFNTNTADFFYETLPTRNIRKICISIPKDISDTTKYVIDTIEDKNFDLNKAVVKLEIYLESSNLLSIKRNEIENYLQSKNVFHITNISETKKSNIIKKDETYTINTDMNILSLLKNYSENNIEEKNRDLFLELSNEIYNEYKKAGNS